MTTTVDQYRGALLGLALGDALGAPYEGRIPPFWVDLEFLPGVHGTQPGHPTDDSYLAAAVAQSLLESPDRWPDDYVACLVKWARTDPPDIGEQTAVAANCWSQGAGPPEDQHAQGNGSLMAVTPVVLRYATNREVACTNAGAFARLTHPSTVAAETNVRFTEALLDVLDGRDPPRVGELPAEPHSPHMGWCLLTYELALLTYERAQSFGPVEALLELIMLGGDTDTNAAVAGALLGARYGAGAWPPHVIEQLHFGPVMTDLADRLWAARSETALGLPGEQ